MKERGRRTALTPQLKRRICAMLRRGHTVGTTCGAVGISDRSFFDYCAKDAAFLAETQRARAQGRVRLVDSILDDRDWRGKAWYLERTAPAEFGRVEARPLPEPEEKKKVSVAIILNSGGKTLEQLAHFPVRAEAAAQIAGEQTSPESEPPESVFDGDISRLGPVEHDVPLDAQR